MKHPMTEPATSLGAAGSLLSKFGVPLGFGVLGAAVMAAVDLPRSRGELFRQAFVAGTSTLVFGRPAYALVAPHVPSAVPEDELRIAVYFLVGSLSWGAAAVLVRARALVKSQGIKYINKKIGSD